MNTKKTYWPALLILICLAIYVFVFSMWALWLGDDFNDGSRAFTLRNIISSQINHYTSVNGRAVAHLFCQLYIPVFGKTIFAISNALLYIGLLLMMASLCSIKYNEWKMIALLACLIILGFRTKFTPTCQIGFPWMFALVTAFLLILRKFGKEQPNPWKGYHLIWATPFAILAGWSQEALVIGIGVALGVFVLLNIRKVTPAQWLLLICFAVGAALLCFSPATLGRKDEAHGGSNLLPPFVLSLAKLGFYLRVSYLMLGFSLYLRIFKKIKFKDIFSQTRFYWIVWLTLLIFNLFIGVYGNRQLFGMEFAAIIIILRLVQLYILPAEGNYKKAGYFVLAILGLWVAVVAVGNGRFLSHHKAVCNYIDSSYKASTDGIVYYDFSAKEVTSKDTNPSDVFTWWAIFSLKQFYGKEKPLQVLPTICKDVKQMAMENQWERIAEGAMAIVIDKNHLPSRIMVKRSLMKKTISDMGVNTSEPVFETENNMVLLLYEKIPLVKYDHVVFEYE